MWRTWRSVTKMLRFHDPSPTTTSPVRIPLILTKKYFFTCSRKLNLNGHFFVDKHLLLKSSWFFFHWFESFLKLCLHSGKKYSFFMLAFCNKSQYYYCGLVCFDYMMTLWDKSWQWSFLKRQTEWEIYIFLEMCN